MCVYMCSTVGSCNESESEGSVLELEEPDGVQRRPSEPQVSLLSTEERDSLRRSLISTPLRLHWFFINTMYNSGSRERAGTTVKALCVSDSEHQ